MYAKRLGLSRVLCLCEGEKRAGSCHFRSLNHNKRPVDHDKYKERIAVALQTVWSYIDPKVRYCSWARN